VSRPARGRAWSLVRLSLEEGALTLRHGRAPVAAGPGLLAPAPVAGSLLVTDFDGSTRMASWSPDGRIVTGARAGSRGYPLAVIGDGDGRRVLLLPGSFLSDDGADPVLSVLDPGLEPVATIDAGVTALAFRELSAVMRQADAGEVEWPYVGLLPGGLADGRQAFIFNGVLVAEETSANCTSCLSVTPIATLAGTAVMGLAGDQGRWLALARSQRAFHEVSLHGGLLRLPDLRAEQWSVVPAAAVLAAPSQPLELNVAHRGVATPSAGHELLLARRDGFITQLRAPSGSRAYLLAGEAWLLGPNSVGPDGVQFSVAPQAIDADLERLSVRLFLVAESGRTGVESFELLLLGDRPELEIVVGQPAFSPRVPLSGRVSQGAVLAIDGRQVATDRLGRFAVDVPAGLWPREVALEATDPFGRRSQASVSVVGFVDYRRLPWPTIALVMTMLAGLALYLRAPRSARRPRAGGDGPASFEELSGDR
jgi:hypothetical protein